MRLLVTRHGQTDWNVENKVCGRTDVSLTQEGQEQAKKMAALARKHQPDLIISSPMKRALETAKAAAESCGVEITVDERLIEQDFGCFEGVDRKDPGFLENKRHFAYRYPGGESMLQLAHRVYSLLDEIKERYSDKTVLLVCHGAVCRVLHSYFADMTNDEFFHYTIDNAELIEYRL